MKNYLEIVPFVGDMELDDVLCIDKIINDMIEGEIYDHLFYITDRYELMDYDSLKEVSSLLFSMVKDCYSDLPEIDSIKVYFCNFNIDSSLWNFNCTLCRLSMCRFDYRACCTVGSYCKKQRTQKKH